MPKSINKILDNNNDEYIREERTFRKWINSLELKDKSGERIYVNDLNEQSKDGIILLLTLDKIKPGIVNWRIVTKVANNPFKRTVNCNEVIDACKKAKLSISSIGGGDIRDGNKKYILYIIWAMMKRYTLEMIGNKIEQELISWGNEKVEYHL